MFRWPLTYSPLSLGSSAASRDATLEITPRGAVFTLAALAHIGHPAHLAVIDAYLKGQMRVTGTAGIGEDSRLVLSALAAPLVAAHELGVKRISLADLILLPPALASHVSAPTAHPAAHRDTAAPAQSGAGRPAADNGPPRAPDSARFLLHVSGDWHWVRAAEHFELPGCLGTPQPGLGSRWHDTIVRLPERPTVSQGVGTTSGLAPIDAEVRAATTPSPIPEPQVAALRALALARFARSGGRIRAVVDRALGAATVAASAAPAASTHATAASSDPVDATVLPLAADLRAEARSWAVTPVLPASSDPNALTAALAGPIAAARSVETAFRFQGAPVGVSLTPDLDGYQTLCLLPPDGTAPETAFEVMRAAAWATIEALMGRPLAEYRTEPIALRLAGADARSTVLEIGASIVIVRNQTVFTGWVGSDGRVMLKLFPPGGMPGAPAAGPLA